MQAGEVGAGDSWGEERRDPEGRRESERDRGPGQLPGLCRLGTKPRSDLEDGEDGKLPGSGKDASFGQRGGDLRTRALGLKERLGWKKEGGREDEITPLFPVLFFF